MRIQLLTLLATAVTSAWAGGVRIEKDAAYLPPDRTEKADLYFPEKLAANVKAPALLWIHGGGWTSGDKGQKRELNIGNNCAANGYVVMSINYLLQQKGAPPVWPQNLYDCKTAVRWLRANADRLHIDPDRIAVAGGSAGGHLASMVALTRPEDGLDPQGPYGEYSCAVRCGLDFYGPTDLGAMNNYLEMLGKPRSKDPAIYSKASPITYARKNSPPLLILHGTADKTVNITQSEALETALKNAGAVVGFERVLDAPHTFDLQPKQKDLRPVVFAFLDKYMPATNVIK